MRKLWIFTLFFVLLGVCGNVQAQTTASSRERGLRSLKAAHSYRMIGELDGATALANKALAAMKGNKYWEAAATECLGLIYMDRKDTAKAIECFKRALELYRASGHPTQSINALTELLNHFEIYGGVEVGSKGVKMFVLKMKPSSGNGNMAWETLLQATKNTNPLSGTDTALEETAQAVSDFYSQLIDKEKVANERVTIVGSSGLGKATAEFRARLKTMVQEKTGKSMDFLDAATEGFYTTVGNVPVLERLESFCLDLGSGNTKGGYVEVTEPQYGTGTNASKQFTLPPHIAIEIRYGTKSLKDEAEKAGKTDEEFLQAIESLRNGALKSEIAAVADAKPAIENRKSVFLCGGIVWAFTTLCYPEQIQEGFVEINPLDIDNFYAKITTTPDQVLSPDLSRLPQDVGKNAGEVIQRVKEVFNKRELVAGMALLKAISDGLKFNSKKITFTRTSGWLPGYIAVKAWETLSNVTQGE